MTRASRVRWVLVAAVSCALLAAQPVDAKVEGACSITVQGIDISGREATIPAPADGNLTYNITAAIPVVRWSVTLHYGPFERVVIDRPFEQGATSEEGVFSVAEYTKYGTGLYRVTGAAVLSDGSTCTGTMDLKVAGSPFTTVVGLAAVAILGAAGVGLLLTILQIVFDAKDVVDGAKDFIVEAKARKTPATGAPANAPADAPAPWEPPGPPPSS